MQSSNVHMSFPFSLMDVLNKYIKEISSYLMDDFSHLSQEEKIRKCQEVRSKAAFAASAITPLPIPFADIWTVTPVQMAMVRAIGNIYGYKLNEKTVKESFAVVGGGWLGQQVCLALFKIGMPGAGGFGGAAFVFGWTHGIGYAAEKYFKSGMKASKEELEDARKQGVEQSKTKQPLSTELQQIQDFSKLKGWISLNDCKQNIKLFQNLDLAEIQSYFTYLVVNGYGETRNTIDGMEYCSIGNG